MIGFKVEFSDGTSWIIPAQKIAELRADYYATEVDGHEKYSTEWLEEFNFSMSSNNELEDWIANNTNWEDVKDFAIQYSEAKPICNRRKEYLDQEFEFIDIEL